MWIKKEILLNLTQRNLDEEAIIPPLWCDNRQLERR
jgi:hypothetical protein